MALHDEILLEIVAGRIPFVFKKKDLLNRKDPETEGRFIIGSKSYSRNSICVIPPNHSISRDGQTMGDYVKKGRKPAFYRLGGGYYQLILTETYVVDLDSVHEVGLSIERDVMCGEEGDNESLITNNVLPDCGNTTDDLTSPDFSTPVIVADKDNLDPVQIIIETLEQRPYQYYFKKQRKWYPPETVVGWEARLANYFWPNLESTWERNVPTLELFVNRFKELGLGQPSVDIDSTSGKLVTLFSEICVWGGVKLPEVNSDKLLKEVKGVLEVLDRGEEPHTFRINSAWTKLYAIARPSTCVIYDSRVAASLTSILDPYMSKLDKSISYAPYRALGYVSGRGGSRPRKLNWKWPNGYSRWDAQCAANRICLAVVNRMNENRKDEVESHIWTLREVEAVLFMDGY